MDIFAELGIDGYINAHDTYTVYGGSRMPPAGIAALCRFCSTAAGRRRKDSTDDAQRGGLRDQWRSRRFAVSGSNLSCTG